MNLFKKKVFWIFLVLLLILFIGFIYMNLGKNKMEKSVNKFSSNNKLKKEVGTKIKKVRFNLSSAYYIYYPKIGNKKIDKKINSIKDELLKDSKISFNGKYKFIDYATYLAPDNIISIVFKSNIINSKGRLKSVKIYTLNIGIKEKEVLKDTYIFVKDYKKLFKNYIYEYIKKNKLDIKKDYDIILNNKYNYKYILTKKGVNVYFDSKEILKSNKELVITIPYDYLSSVLNIDINNNIKKYKNLELEKEVFEDVNKTMYVNKLSNIYLKGSKNSKFLSLAHKGNKASVKSESKNYSYVENENFKGYILNSSLTDNIVSDEGFTDNLDKVYAKDDIDVKSEPNDTSKTLGTFKFGEEITRIGTNENGYSEIIYNNEKGFVKTENVQLNKPVSKSIGTKGVNESKKMVALTFDDGPNPSSTGRILDTLVKYNVTATFFDLGSLVDTYPSVVKREEQVGCEVGSHTYGHLNLNNLTVDGVINEINKSKKAFEKALGHDVSLLRPPYGNANAIVLSNIPYPVINWNVDTLDWKTKNKDAIVNEIRKISNLDGKIVLMHSIYETTADAVEVIVPELINQGYELVTVSQLASYKGVTLQPKVKYYGF